MAWLVSNNWNPCPCLPMKQKPSLYAPIWIQAHVKQKCQTEDCIKTLSSVCHWHTLTVMDKCINYCHILWAAEICSSVWSSRSIKITQQTGRLTVWQSRWFISFPCLPLCFHGSNLDLAHTSPASLWVVAWKLGYFLFVFQFRENFFLGGFLLSTSSRVECFRRTSTEVII